MMGYVAVKDKYGRWVQFIPGVAASQYQSDHALATGGQLPPTLEKPRTADGYNEQVTLNGEEKNNVNTGHPVKRGDWEGA